MKIQNLAIIFIIIILPISLVLASYTKTRVETLNLQAEYDTKLNSATHDALKAYQINSFQNKTNGFTNSKIRDINASINTFFNSMQSGFSSLGYTKESIQNYIPAIVYTMYDGYYVYTPLRNTWDTDTKNSDINSEMDEQIDPTNQTKYENGETIYDLKPYVYYSCRYKNQSGSMDVVITYSLDNYIQIQGKVNDKTVSKYGYLLNDSLTANGEDVKYENVSIGTENNIQQYVYTGNAKGENIELKLLPCLKKNGTKYYADNDNAFIVSNFKRINQDDSITINNNNSGLGLTTKDDVLNNKNAIKYYKEAYDLKQFININSDLKNLSTDNIVDIDTGKTYKEEGKDSPYTSLGYIFGGTEEIESEKSNFNLHRIEVIKNAIERNLSIVIANYSGTDAEYKLPKLKDTDWDKITDNIGIITFMQNVNIGGKVYNGYSIVSNTKNEDVVTYDSIYIKDKNNVCHSITEDFSNFDFSNAVGIFNVDIEKRNEDDSDQNSKYYFPIEATLSYDSLITKNKINKDSVNVSRYEYIKNSGNNNLKKIVYTALARERYGLYRAKLEI